MIMCKQQYYYLNKVVMGQLIANFVKVIGQDKLIRRTGASTKTRLLKLKCRLGLWKERDDLIYERRIRIGKSIVKKCK